jgi:hypothetical protein
VRGDHHSIYFCSCGPWADQHLLLFLLLLLLLLLSLAGSASLSRSITTAFCVHVGSELTCTGLSAAAAAAVLSCRIRICEQVDHHSIFVFMWALGWPFSAVWDLVFRRITGTLICTSGGFDVS